VCFDESPVQLTSETRHPLPARPGQPERYDCEYKREGTANLFLFVQPLRGWRHVNVTQQRTPQDFAQQMRLLVDQYFPTAERIRWVVDNLNTHTPAALYGVFPPDEACPEVSKGPPDHPQARVSLHPQCFDTSAW
jgi:DDE superfamily endonuclease